MNQQPDELFREKLEGHQQPAPPAAWNKIEAGLKKPKSTYPWFMAAAAAILILVVASIVIVLQDDTIEPENISTNDVQPKNTIPKIKKSVEIPPASSTNDVIISKKKQPPAKIKPVPEHTLKEFSQTPETISNVADKVSEKNTLAELQSEELKEVKPATVSSSSPENFKLVLNAEEVNQKYLANSSATEATPPEKKSSKLKKLLNKVQELKTNQDPFGELREKKNEILALDFKNQKQRK